MKSRIITGVVGISLMLIVLLVLPPITLNIVIAALCGIAMYELLHAAQIKHLGVTVLSILFAVSTPFLLLATTPLLAVGVLVIYTALLGFCQVFGHESLKVEQTGFVYMLSIIAPAALSSMAYFRKFSPEHGLFYIFLALIMAWMCDIGAYFVGVFFGKHKLCPKISPKKTVEGFVGGLVVAVLSSLLAGFVYSLVSAQPLTVHYGQIALLSLVCALLSVIGDLFASVIKRGYGVKDFGHIIPGHGGVMDRFDSLLFVAPMLLVLVQFWPLVQTA